ncbi:hypothetical protein Sjap_011483 [Stephania japonica]|uniref:Pentatricopeptide repeat-containing protein n=1 Tax=Stephania japonica TaxID=461633 RepID=A0AAP0JDB1_9MAGN
MKIFTHQGPKRLHCTIIPQRLIHTTTTNSQQSPTPPTTPPEQIIATQFSNCTYLLDLKRLHAQIIRTRMLERYPAPFHWNNIIRSYVRLNHPNVALKTYIAMSRTGVLPDCYTIPIVLKAMCQCFDVELGRKLHCLAVKVGLDSQEFCESGFISLYAKAGDLGDARKVFDESPERKLGSWNAVIAGLAHGGHARDVVVTFMELMRSGLRPDDVTMVSVISACGSLGDFRLGVQLHKCVIEAKALEKSDVLMSNSLIDMYGKCGRTDLAYKVFKGMGRKDVSTWTSLIMGYAMQGQVKDAIECFRLMREAGIRPNHVTFVGVLSACVHGGLVEEGKRYFEMMKNDYGLMPLVQHYGVMADLLGRAGLLREAREMVETMPMKANAVIWGALMGGCEKHGCVEMGEWVARHLQELEPWNDGVYVVLSNIYASSGMWEDVERIRGMMKNKMVDKTPGYSLTTASN